MLTYPSCMFCCSFYWLTFCFFALYEHFLACFIFCNRFVLCFIHFCCQNPHFFIFLFFSGECRCHFLDLKGFLSFLFLVFCVGVCYFITLCKFALWFVFLQQFLCFIELILCGVICWQLWSSLTYLCVLVLLFRFDFPYLFLPFRCFNVLIAVSYTHLRAHETS